MLALTGKVLQLLREAEREAERSRRGNIHCAGKLTDNQHRLSLAARESVNALNTDESNCKWCQRVHRHPRRLKQTLEECYAVKIYIQYNDGCIGLILLLQSFPTLFVKNTPTALSDELKDDTAVCLSHFSVTISFILAISPFTFCPFIH